MSSLRDVDGELSAPLLISRGEDESELVSRNGDVAERHGGRPPLPRPLWLLSFSFFFNFFAICPLCADTS